jgi:ribosomal protein L40E
MSEYLGSVRAHVEEGTVSGQTLVLLFRAGEEAEERRDLDALEETMRLARRVAEAAAATLRTEADRLVVLCEERLARARASIAETAAADEDICPGCGRPVPANAVRCRACGTLLV